MEVILLERIARLGAIGETVKVRNGYGRNFLIPMKKALRATEENKKIFEERRHIIEEQNAAARKEAEVHAKKIDGLSVKLSQSLNLASGPVIAGVYKERGFASALGDKVAELEHLGLKHEVNEVAFVLFHGVRLG